MHSFSTKQLEFLRNHVVGRSKRDLTELFNKHFQLDLLEKQIKSCCKRHKLPLSGLDGRFKLGRTPFNKGLKGSFGGEDTQFKKGNKPHNYKPVGTERVNGDGYVDIKVADPNKWRAKHTLIWQEANGPVPKGHAIIFGDGNRRNFELDNLVLVSRKQLAMLNKHHLIKDNADLTRTGVILTDILMKISERTKAK